MVLVFFLIVCCERVSINIAFQVNSHTSDEWKDYFLQHIGRLSLALTDSPDAHDATSTQVGQAAPSNSRPTVQHQGAGAEREQQSLSVTIQEAARKNIRNRPSSPTPSASVVRDGKGISSRPKPIVQIQRRPNTTHVARPLTKSALHVSAMPHIKYEKASSRTDQPKRRPLARQTP